MTPATLSPAPRRARPLAALVAACLLLSVVAQPAPADDGTATAAAPPPAALALKQRTVYRHTPFEMTVRPPITVASGVIIESLRFPSPVETKDRERNDVVRGRLFRTEQPTRAAVIAIGGWKFDPLTPMLAQQIAESGIQVVWLEIPFQGQRTPRGEKTGHLTLSSDLDGNEAVFVQLSQDIGRLTHWLVTERNVDPDRIGLLGTSLGGFVSATLYGMHERYKAVTVQLAGADVAGVIYNGNWLTQRLRRELEDKGLTESAVRNRMRLMSPETWVDKARKQGVLFVAAELDEIVPLDAVRELAEAYGGAPVHIMKGEEHRAQEGLQLALPTVRAHFEKLLLERSGKAQDAADKTGSGADASPPAPGGTDDRTR